MAEYVRFRRHVRAEIGRDYIRPFYRRDSVWDSNYSYTTSTARPNLNLSAYPLEFRRLIGIWCS
jgi:hypothetical protein